MKIYVYAISKNEEKFARRWAESMAEADEIYVLDTGSTDNTVKILKECGVRVAVKEIKPWRFDTTRNESLKLVPEDADICVCTDIDEVFHKGWRGEMEKAWKNGVTRLRYRYTWNFDENGNEKTVFFVDKAHSRKNYSWVNPVHEVLEYCGKNEKFAFAQGVQLDHLADNTKSRGQYLELLELAVRENPENDRNMHYLAREYMFYGRFKEAISAFERHLKMENATWRDERCASLRFTARCYASLGDFENEYKYRLLAIIEAPYLREPWVEMGYSEYEKQNYIGGAYFMQKALQIKKRELSYISDSACWGALPYDVLSICLYNTGDAAGAIDNAKKAIALSDEQRLKDNLKFFEKQY